MNTDQHPHPFQAPYAAAVTTPEPMEILTAVISGTTKHVFAGRTLAFDWLVTVGDVLISITTSR